MHVVYRHYQVDGQYVLKAFTGMITDKAGRKRYYVNGKPVKHEHYTGAGHKEHGHTREQSRQAITAALASKTLSHAGLTELAEHLNNITAVELKKLRTQHGVASVKNPTKDKLVNAFLDHIRTNVNKPVKKAKPVSTTKPAPKKKIPPTAKESVSAKVDTDMGTAQTGKVATIDPNTDLPGFARAVQELADTAPPEHRYHDNLAYIGDLYERTQESNKFPKMTLDQFKQWILKAGNQLHLNLQRADLVQEMPEEKVAKSETKHPLGAQFHFVRTTSKKKTSR